MTTMMGQSVSTLKDLMPGISWFGIRAGAPPPSPKIVFIASGNSE